MPWLSRLAQTGVWISHLAQAGFYRPEGSEGKLRCAFCNLDVDSAQLEGTRPMDVHRQLSPNCRFVTGQHATESQPREALGPDYLQMMFAPERQASQASPPQEHQTAGDVSRIGASLSSEVPESPSPARPPRGSEGAVEDSQYQLPHPGQLLTNQNAASVTQASASYQPVSLPMNVQTSDRSSLLGAAQLQQVPQPASLSVQTSSASGRLVQQATQQPSQQAHVYQTARPSTTDRQRSPAEGSQSQDPAQTPTSAAARNVAEIPAQQSGSSTAAAPAEVPSSQNASTSSETPRQVVTYAQLGIFTQQPKRQDMVVGATRCNTFSGWPHAETHTPEEMSDAGFYYTGHSDLVRCFYCKGGLKSWAEHLRPWVEHARFFPECPSRQKR
nr:hypothetical protein BaRGS_001937 [Batillaria attramentaria]